MRRVSAVYTEAAPFVSPAWLLLSANRLAWTGTACGVLGAVLVTVRAAVGGAASGPLLVAAVVCFGYAIACYALAYARRVGAFFVRGRPAADGDRTVWYCERCNAVFTEKTG